MPNENLTRVEFEARMSEVQVAMRSRMTEMQEMMRSEMVAMRMEHKADNDHQDEEWNKGFRALRDDQATAFNVLRQDLRSFVTTDVFVARLTPVQAVAYGLVALLMTLMTGMLAMGLLARSTGKLP